MKILGDFEVHIRLKQGEAHLAQRVIDVRLTDASMPAEVFEDILQFVGEAGKHGRRGD